MAADDSATSVPSRHDTRWRGPLIALCGLFALYLFVSAADNFGLGGRPWLGWFDGGGEPTPGQPFVMTLEQVQPGGALWRAGLRDGDRLDLRDFDLSTRLQLMYEPLATQATTLVARRGSDRFVTSFTGSIWSDGESAVKLPTVLIALATGMWCLVCALIIAVRRSWSPEGRTLAIVLIALGLGGANPVQSVVLPNVTADVLLWSSMWILGFVALALLVSMASRVGVRTSWRTALEFFVYAAIAVGALGLGAGYVGELTLWFDPFPFWSYNSAVATAVPAIELGVVVLAAIAVASAPRVERPRAAWLLLPLPIALAASQAALALQPFAPSFVGATGLIVLASAIALLGALFVTYALLKRRVFDTAFILSRTIVVGLISLIVVAAFVLLEWLLGSVVAGASHATGLIANAALALVLGLLLRYIHRRIDAFVYAVLFRKRHEDERALRAFSKEAAFVTEREALLDQAVDHVRVHTDARAAALFVRENGAYKALRRFGQTPTEVDENDPAILALKTWHKPFDPHSYTTALQGDLALPMVARGRLVGVLLCGERDGGEAYAPDEVDALSEFAHGVGSALDILGAGREPSVSDRLLEAITAFREETATAINALRNSIEQQTQDRSAE